MKKRRKYCLKMVKCWVMYTSLYVSHLSIKTAMTQRGKGDLEHRQMLTLHLSSLPPSKANTFFFLGSSSCSYVSLGKGSASLLLQVCIVLIHMNIAYESHTNIFILLFIFITITMYYRLKRTLNAIKYMQNMFPQA